MEGAATVTERFERKPALPSFPYGRIKGADENLTLGERSAPTRGSHIPSTARHSWCRPTSDQGRARPSRRPRRILELAPQRPANGFYRRRARPRPGAAAPRRAADEV